MTNYEYSSYSSSTTPSTAHFDASKAIFNQVDVNHDGAVDRQEFQQWVSAAGDGTGTNADAGDLSHGQYISGGGGGVVNGSGDASTNFQSSSYDSSNISSLLGGHGLYSGIDGGITGSSSTTLDTADNIIDGSNIQSSFQTRTNLGFDDTSINQATNYTAETNANWSKYGAEVRGAGLFFDTNPQIIRRPAPGGVQTYTQNIQVRFLQPPPVPPPGPLIIKEVRESQAPLPPPLRIRQQAPPVPQPPPLILRERPPPPPPSQSSQTVIRKLPALPVPPRSVIIERIPAAPPRPRDIIIERWIPYESFIKRKTIVQRAESAKEYPKPRNVIIQYEPVQVRVVRQFQRLGVVQENPQLYTQRYGQQLLDAQTLIQQARAVGVVEDISPPSGAVSAQISSSSFSQESSLGGGGGVSYSGSDLVDVAGGTLGGIRSSFSTGSFQNSQMIGTGLTGANYESGLIEGVGADGGFGSLNNESSLYSSSNIGSVGQYGIAAGLPTGYSSSSYDSSGGATNFDVAAAAFNIVDKNKDGTLDANEFKQFYEAGL
ncbi:unnamed protein product [Rotaria sp. Silwood1]|nr:unnamed protein product [Rotaria sp. Silwood1]CAF1629282.1 unnamed protein product [Rotaria sp. Silwood1]